MRYFKWSSAVAAICLVAACGNHGNNERTKAIQDKTVPSLAGLFNRSAQSMSRALNPQLLQAVYGAGAQVMQVTGSNASSGAARQLKALRDAANNSDADQIAAVLNERIFNDANVESVDGDTVTYLLHGNVVCAMPSMQPDSGCVQAVDNVQMRLKVTQSQNGADIDVLVGSGRALALALAVQSEPKQSVSLTVDLETFAKASAEAYAAFGGGVAPVTAFASSGKVQVTITSDGADAVTEDFRTLTPLHFADDGGSSLDIGKADPMVHLATDGTRTTFAYNVPAVDAVMPTKAIFPDATGGVLKAHLAGVSLKATIGHDDQLLMLQHVALGNEASTLYRGDTLLAKLDVNADASRSFDVTLAPTSDGTSATMAVAPSLQATLAVRLAPLADDGVTVPQAFADDVYTLALTGDKPTILPIAGNDPLGLDAGGLQVVSGQLHLAARGADLTVPQGSCLLPVAQPAQGSHPVLGRFSVGACP